MTSLLFPDAAVVYRQFTVLDTLARFRFEGQLGGKLILLAPLNDSTAAIALAANIAGAALLGIDSDEDRLRWGIRNGVCDFVVNHLDEALRILKNEIRKKQPASVWVQAEPRAILSDAVDRGLQPDILAYAVDEDSALLRILEARGAVTLPSNDAAENVTTEVTWAVDTAAHLWMPKIDAMAAAILPDEQDERRRWLRFAPRYLGREFRNRRYVRFSPEEASRFREAISIAVRSGSIGVPVKLRMAGQDLVDELQVKAV